ncbi:MAG: hypothetical protein GX442_03805 [Candidatus Riflebacteria bacterium]|nr:hypothetical protein [Candidatus Riflebacteria bacterium]
MRGRALNAVAGAERVRVLAREALAALEQNRLVVEFCGEFERNGVSGLSVAWPDRDELAKWGRFYGVLDFARVTHWDEFLAAWHAL